MSGLQISCTIPMRGNAPIVPTRDDLWCLRCWACTLNILQLRRHGEGCPKRGCECEAILVGVGLLHVKLFLQTDPWEPNFCKSTHEKHPPAWKKNLMPFWPLSSSNQIWLHKDIRVNHSPWQQLGSWFHVPISNFSSSKNLCLILVQGGNPSPDLVSKCNKSCLESSGIAPKESHPESEQNQPLVVRLSCTRLR